MNVRMHPTVRCTYDAEENVLRLILQEGVEQTNVLQQDSSKWEIVVYALKVCYFLPLSPPHLPGWGFRKRSTD